MTVCLGRNEHEITTLYPLCVFICDARRRLSSPEKRRENEMIFVAAHLQLLSTRLQVFTVAPPPAEMTTLEFITYVTSSFSCVSVQVCCLGHKEE